MPAAATAPKIDLAEWQDHLDFLLPRKEFLRADEVARALSVDDRTVLRLFDLGLPAHDLNAAAQQRKQVRYRRTGVILFLAQRANYSPADQRQRLLELLATLSLRELALIHASLGDLIRRKQA